MRNGWRLLAASLLIALFFLQLYRAATLSLTVDEARAYIDFIRPEPAALLSHYDAAHHVLQTYLSWFFAKRWGSSEIVLRIPALIAAVAYFIWAFRFSAKLFNSGPMFLGSVLVLAANPLILDHLALARGYGVALALFAWAMTAAIDDRLFAAGMLSGLSVAANLTFLVPVCALAIVTFLFTSRRSSMLHEYIGPGAITCALIVTLPLLHAGSQHFYYGAASIPRMFMSMVEASFGRSYWGAPIIVFSTALGAFALFAAAVGLWRGGRDARMISATLAIALAATIALRLSLKTPYPYYRTAMWLLFLVTAAGLAAIAASAAIQPRIRVAGAAIALAAGLVYLAQYDPRFSYEWRGTAAVKRYMRSIRDHESARQRTFTVSGDADLKFPIDYYRIRLRLDNMREMQFENPHPAADYYIFNGSDRFDEARAWNLATIEDDTVCRCLLAAR